MFEDSTFESNGKIRTRSRRWMLVTFALNASVLLALILIPLIYPEALPRMASIMLMEAPAPLPETPRPVHVPPNAVLVHTDFNLNVLVVPSRIPRGYDPHQFLMSEFLRAAGTAAPAAKPLASTIHLMANITSLLSKPNRRLPPLFRQASCRVC